MKSYFRDNCRLCKSKNIEKVLELEATPPADSYINTKSLLNNNINPLDLYFCNNCSHTQLGHVIDAEEVYMNYIYETESTLGLGSHFKDCANKIIAKFSPPKGSLVLDIGSNDGILLKYFKDHELNVLGVDPMPGIDEKALKLGIKTLSRFFDNDLVDIIKKDYQVPSIISSNNLVANIDDLDSFILNVRSLMDNNTIFFFESFYFYSQVLNNNWDFTYHEHLSYFTISPLKKYFNSHDMEIIDVESNNTKGGSMRVTVQKKGGSQKINSSVNKFIKNEEDNNFNTKIIFKNYDNNIKSGKQEYRSFMDSLIKENKKIIGFGASATSTTLIYNYEINKDIEYLVDDYKAKQNLYSPGFNIPVYGPEKIYKDNVDYIVILACRYKDKIIEKNKKFLEQGGKFIVPLPKLELIEK